MPVETPKAIICDANVLIHYYLADKQILKLVVQHVGPVVVPRPVLDDEVDGLDIEEAASLGLTVLEPEDAYIIRAGSQGGPLSKHDRLILALAKDNGFICWTSDSPLKKQCEKDGISTCWGLEMMLLLFQNGHLSESAAIRIARKIHEMDRGYITLQIVEEFERKLKEMRSSRSTA
jgi:predicted nucleic acid-binding protein